MPTTTNFGWTTPADTDLVKDGASAMRTLGNGIDTSLVYLKGGTTGQILSKTSNTDLAFTWINNDQGDITAVTAGTGLSGGGTSGAVSLAIDTATTVDKTTAQTLTNKTISGASNTISNISLTTGVTGTLPIGNGGTNLTTYTTGDLPYASSTNTLSKLAIGTTGQVLTVSGGVPAWGAAASGALTLVKTQTIGSAVSSVTVTGAFSSTYDNYVIFIYGGTFSATANFTLQLGSTTSGYYHWGIYGNPTSATVNGDNMNNGSNFPYAASGSTTGAWGKMELFSPNRADETMMIGYSNRANTSTISFVIGSESSSTQHTDFTLTCSSGTATGGTIAVYGYQKS